MYEVIFEAGSLKGKRWRLPDGGVLTIGRSHSCGIRPKEPDVSGKHAVLREEAGVVWLEVLSSHNTAVDGVRLPVGERVAITEVSQVVLGGGLAFRLGKTSSDDETGEIMPAETGTLGTGTVATAATRAMRPNTATLGDDTGTLSGTLATAATRAMPPNTATLGDDTGTVATAATRAMPPNTATLGDDTGTLDSTGTVATAATRAYRPESGTLPSNGSSSRRARGVPRAKPSRPVADEGETQMVTGLNAMPGSGGETTDLDSGGETQMLATQAVSADELERLRGRDLKLKKRRIGIRAAIFAAVLAAVFGLYLYLSHQKPDSLLIMPEKISFDGVVETEGGCLGITVPNIGGGNPTYSDDSVIRYDTRLGRNWEVPYTIVLTNWYDRQSLHESAEATFARWRTANMIGLWVDKGESDSRHIFMGGQYGEYPGIPCLQHIYSKVGPDHRNISGTATFFRIGARCYVLMRELPANEEWRGIPWLTLVWSTLYVPDEYYDGSENMIVARHWEGTPTPDSEMTPAEIVRGCVQSLDKGAQNKWEAVRQNLYVAMRMLEGKNDAISVAVRNQALVALEKLRKSQKRFFGEKRFDAQQWFFSPWENRDHKLDEITKSLKTYFSVEDDERTWILGNERWWL